MWHSRSGCGELSRVKRVLTAVVLIPLVLLAIFRAPTWLFALLLLLIGVLATLEYLHIAERTGLVPFRRYTLLMVAAFFLFSGGRIVLDEQWRHIERSSERFSGVNPEEYPRLNWAWKTAIIGGNIVVAMPLLLLVWAMKRQQLNTSLPGAACSSFALVYPALPLLTLILIRAHPFGSLLLLYLLLVVWVGDIFAYYVGSTVGNHKLAPRISPGKSWEGAAASLIGASLLGTYIVQHARPLQEFLESIHLVSPGSSEFGFALQLYAPPWWHGLLLSVAVNVAAQLGDLVESMLKRGAGVKDSGTLLPGHGGVLDRIDALLFAAPVVFYYAQFRGVPF